ncbi:response regulator [Leptospira idonii]|uniref:DNA-binding response regulator n=1 Tax=Leptospira idonii TaxID=1193500 RepID=A0A4R9M300_9LEPT|nr:response regulator [Leptospira idonii]TGN20371.1 DNA-binding response regulator [Leptospira idonii]
MKKVLIVDDNDRYANNLTSFFKEKGIASDRALDAAEGWRLYSADKTYDMIVSDVTMETQTSGLWMMRRIHKDGYAGVKVIASTGFDVWGVMGFSSWFLPLFCGLHWMIPKVPLKQGTVEWHPTRLKNKEPKPFL